MKINFAANMVAACVLTATSMSVSAIEENASTVDLSFRYRVEAVDIETSIEDANASTLLTRLTVKTKWSSKVDSVIEFDDVSEVGVDDYNAGQGNSPDKGMYPIVADPIGTEVNQAFFRYNGRHTKTALGRQRILVGNQRYVGGVGWRQNEQTYDSLTVKNKVNDKFSFDYAYVFNVNRIFGEAVDAGDHKHNTHLINFDYKFATGKLSAYYFSIDNETAFGLSNNTRGVRYAGKVNNFAYTFEFASQSEAGDNANDYTADYLLAEGAFKKDNYSFGVGLEVLGGDVVGGQGFTTSLATLHKFQGWADVFLATPTTGIEDLFINASFKVKGTNIKFVYHDFSSDEIDLDLGTELDIAISKKFTKRFSGLLKYADFEGEPGGLTSRTKIWLMLTYKL